VRRNDRNRSRFRSPAIYEVAHILLAAPRRDAVLFSKVVQKAESMIAILKRAPDRFADLARGHSDCPSGSEGGNLGQITSGQTTCEFEAALQTLEEGQISDKPVETRYGAHVIRLDRRIDGAVVPFEMVEPKIAQYLREAATDRAFALYVRMLAEQARIDGLDLNTGRPQASV
jgi:peptidyl-prolyl cis-trans isomerase C